MESGNIYYFIFVIFYSECEIVCEILHVACRNHLFIHYMDISLFIYSIIDRHLGYFYLGAMMTFAAVNIRLHFC